MSIAAFLDHHCLHPVTKELDVLFPTTRCMQSVRPGNPFVFRQMILRCEATLLRQLYCSLTSSCLPRNVLVPCPRAHECHRPKLHLATICAGLVQFHIKISGNNERLVHGGGAIQEYASSVPVAHPTYPPSLTLHLMHSFVAGPTGAFRASSLVTFFRHEMRMSLCTTVAHPRIWLRQGDSAAGKDVDSCIQ